MPKDPNPEVERIAVELCREGGEIEMMIRSAATYDTLLSAAVADRVSVHTREIAGRLGREAAAESEKPKFYVYTDLAELLGRTRSSVAEKLQLY